jgi:hypothetical protein
VVVETAPAPVVEVAYVEPAAFVYVSPGVQVIENYDYPVFFVGGVYWRQEGGVWYSSSYHDRGWATSVEVPVTVRGISRPETYTHFRANVNARPGQVGYRAAVTQPIHHAAPPPRGIEQPGHMAHPATGAVAPPGHEHAQPAPMPAHAAGPPGHEPAPQPMHTAAPPPPPPAAHPAPMPAHTAAPPPPPPSHAAPVPAHAAPPPPKAAPPPPPPAKGKKK